MGRLLKPYRSVVLMDGMNIFMVLSIGDDSLLELYEAGEITYDTAANNSYASGIVLEKFVRLFSGF
jgi:hypothetical protein